MKPSSLQKVSNYCVWFLLLFFIFYYQFITFIHYIKFELRPWCGLESGGYVTLHLLNFPCPDRPPPPNICIIYAFTYLNYKEMQICSCTKDNSSLCVRWSEYLFRDVGANVKSVLWYIVLWGFKKCRPKLKRIYHGSNRPCFDGDPKDWLLPCVQEVLTHFI